MSGSSDLQKFFQISDNANNFPALLKAAVANPALRKEVNALALPPKNPVNLLTGVVKRLNNDPVIKALPVLSAKFKKALSLEPGNEACLRLLQELNKLDRLKSLLYILCSALTLKVDEALPEDGHKLALFGREVFQLVQKNLNAFTRYQLQLHEFKQLFDDSAYSVQVNSEDEPTEPKASKPTSSASVTADQLSAVLSDAGNLLESLDFLLNYALPNNPTLNLLPELIRTQTDQPDVQELIGDCLILNFAKEPLERAFEDFIVIYNLSSRDIDRESKRGLRFKQLQHHQQQVESLERQFWAAYNNVYKSQESEGSSIDFTQPTPASSAPVAPTPPIPATPPTPAELGGVGFETKAGEAFDLETGEIYRVKQAPPELVSAKSDAVALIKKANELMLRIGSDPVLIKAVQVGLDKALPSISLLKGYQLQIQAEQQGLFKILDKPQFQHAELTQPLKQLRYFLQITEELFARIKVEIKKYDVSVLAQEKAGAPPSSDRNKPVGVGLGAAQFKDLYKLVAASTSSPSATEEKPSLLFAASEAEPDSGAESDAGESDAGSESSDWSL